MISASSIFTLEPGQVPEALETTPSGLTSNEAAMRLTQYGRNELHEARRQPLYRKLLANFTHLMAILLWVAGAMAFVAGMPQLGVAVWLVVLLNGLFSFWQEYKAERATEALRKLLPVYARVLRDGQEQRIAAEELVPGDVMLLSEGDAISADGRLIQAFELRVDQSTLSGESRPVRKGVDAVAGTDMARAELPNLVFAGTHVVCRHGPGCGLCHRHGYRVWQDCDADAGNGRSAQPSAKGDPGSLPASSPSLPSWQDSSSLPFLRWSPG